MIAYSDLKRQLNYNSGAAVGWRLRDRNRREWLVGRRESEQIFRCFLLRGSGPDVQEVDIADATHCHRPGPVSDPAAGSESGWLPIGADELELGGGTKELARLMAAGSGWRIMTVGGEWDVLTGRSSRFRTHRRWPRQNSDWVAALPTHPEDELEAAADIAIAVSPEDVVYRVDVKGRRAWRVIAVYSLVKLVAQLLLNRCQHEAVLGLLQTIQAAQARYEAAAQGDGSETD